MPASSLQRRPFDPLPIDTAQYNRRPESSRNLLLIYLGVTFPAEIKYNKSNQSVLLRTYKMRIQIMYDIRRERVKWCFLFWSVINTEQMEVTDVTVTHCQLRTDCKIFLQALTSILDILFFFCTTACQKLGLFSFSGGGGGGFGAYVPGGSVWKS
jgi:hypothetical protein